MSDREDYQYWRPRPKRHDFMWWALLLPAVIYAVGVIVYAHAAFSPADIAANGHAIGSALMVVGGEIGTLAAAAEVFRKSQAEPPETNALDWLGLVVSLIATLGNLFVVYSVIDAGLNAEWIRLARRFGPLALLLCSGLDFYAGIMEFGFYNAIFDARMEAWLLAEHNARLRWERRKSDESPVKSGKVRGKSEESRVAQTSHGVAFDESRAKAALQKLRAHASDESPELTEESLEGMSKKERIRYLASNFPQLAQVDIAERADASESYVSRVLTQEESDV